MWVFDRSLRVSMAAGTTEATAPAKTRFTVALLTSMLALAVLPGCAVVTVAGAVAGAAISVTGAVVSTGVKVTGKVIEKTIDIATPDAKPAP